MRELISQFAIYSANGRRFDFGEKERKPHTIGIIKKKMFLTHLYQEHIQHVAGAEGIEPSSKVLETSVLPLNHAPRREKL